MKRAQSMLQELCRLSQDIDRQREKVLKLCEMQADTDVLKAAHVILGENKGRLTADGNLTFGTISFLIPSPL